MKTSVLVMVLMLSALALIASVFLKLRGPCNVTAHVISLPDASRPREAVRDRLRAAGIDAVFVDAVVGTDVRDTSQFVGPYEWRAAQIGCALSHFKVWRLLAERGLAPALIMEDDARPVPHFRTAAASILREIQGAPIDVVFLGHCMESAGQPWRTSTVLRHSVLPRCTHAYYVTQSGLRKLCAWAAVARLRLPIDEELALMCKHGTLVAVSAFPQLARQEWQNAE